LYTVWSTDSNGNYSSNLIGAVAGNSYALESYESVFQQDLNGDGVVGPTETVIATDGSTSLTEVGNLYFSLDGSDGSGPTLKFNGSNVTVGEFGGWVPISAVQTASGYDIAWKMAGADLYTAWAVDNNGNYLSNLISPAPGASTSVWSLETTFGQDLNGDGQIGVPTTVISTDASTQLTQVGNNYFFDAAGTTTGPELTYAGAAVTAGEFAGWTPIGAVQTASGYDIAWLNGSTGLYTVWTTNSNGNYTGNLINPVAGNSVALESLETVFGQDLNGDGVTGLYAAPGTTLQIGQSLAGASGATTIGAGATLEISAADSSSVTFTASTGMLKLDQPSSFSGEIVGFTGNGSLSGSDQIDLKGINYNTIDDSYANGVLTVTDGNGDTAQLNFSGSYTLANFSFASDGSGGTIVYDPPVPASSSATSTAPASNPTSPTETTIANGATVNVSAADTAATKFSGSTGTLVLDGSPSAGQPLDFSGTVSGFGRQNVIDLPGIAFDSQMTLGYLPDSNKAAGILTVEDGTHSASITLLGQYMASCFAMASDGHGGTLLTAGVAQSHDQLVAPPHHA
jgi:serralysin